MQPLPKGQPRGQSSPTRAAPASSRRTQANSSASAVPLAKQVDCGPGETAACRPSRTWATLSTCSAMRRPSRYVTAINATLDDDDVDAIITILTPQAMTQPAETAAGDYRAPTAATSPCWRRSWARTMSRRAQRLRRSGRAQLRHARPRGGGAEGDVRLRGTGASVPPRIVTRVEVDKDEDRDDPGRLPKCQHGISAQRGRREGHPQRIRLCLDARRRRRNRGRGLPIQRTRSATLS
jgi:hypothetical protein